MFTLKRKDIVFKRAKKKIKFKNRNIISNVLEGRTPKKIKNLQYIDDEAANIFAVKVRKEEFYKPKESF